MNEKFQSRKLPSPFMYITFSHDDPKLKRIFSTLLKLPYLVSNKFKISLTWKRGMKLKFILEKSTKIFLLIFLNFNIKIHITVK